MDENTPPRQAVRFTSNNEEIEPDRILPDGDGKPREDLSPEAVEELRSLSKRMQMNRMNSGYEPISLPSSRAPSPSSAAPLNQGGRPMQRQSPAPSPPLTPAASHLKDARLSVGGYQSSKLAQVNLTPNMSPAQGIPNHTKQQAHFSTGSPGDSVPASRETSPTASSVAPGTDARSKRLPWSRNVDDVDDNSKVTSTGPRASYSGTSSIQLPRSSGKAGSASDLKSLDVKQHHHWLSGLRHNKHEDNHAASGNERHGSINNLKRFFKVGGHKHKDKSAETGTNEYSSSRSARSGGVASSGTMTPPHKTAQVRNIPFADDHGLEQKYGRIGRVLGSGAGGSVRLLQRNVDSTVFAVKQFRPRHANESQKDYFKKISGEYTLGSNFHHCNVIETLELIHENGNYYEVMEYAPYDLFATVMSGKMSRAEIACATVQILNGVAYLHSLGVAHRDIKLDNVVINKDGIMKLIDFGSAVIFRYPGETTIELASGIVGSDPYLAPEVYELKKYDPRPADIWSIAIVFCCMTLRRFPWKRPQLSDSSFKLFAEQPSPGQPIDEYRRYSEAPGRLTSEAVNSEHQRRQSAPMTEGGPAGHHRHHNNSSAHGDEKSDSSATATSGRQGSVAIGSTSALNSTKGTTENETITGPWRLLRLLPRESRHIIMRMLDLNHGTRATLEEIFEDKWIKNVPFCRCEEDGTVIRAEGHEHTLEAPAVVLTKLDAIREIRRRLILENPKTPLGR